MSTIGAIAQAVALALQLINSHIEDPRRRARAIADYIGGLRKLQDQLTDEKDIFEIDDILLTIISARP